MGHRTPVAVPRLRMPQLSGEQLSAVVLAGILAVLILEVLALVSGHNGWILSTGLALIGCFVGSVLPGRWKAAVLDRVIGLLTKSRNRLQ